VAENGKAKRLLTRIIASPVMQKAVGLVNRFGISSLGIQVTSALATVMDKDWFDKVLYFQRLFNLLQDVEGDVVECGVASGNSLAILANLVRSGGITRHIWGFDTWSGLPEPGREDLASEESKARKSMFALSSIQSVNATLRFYGFDDSEISNMVTLVRGLFSETLPVYAGPQIALLHIDADLYASYMDALRHLWPKVSAGGIVAFDEYQQPDYWPGAKQAVDEFIKDLPGTILEKDPLYDRYYAVKKT
jgi:hypothetical protein